MSNPNFICLSHLRWGFVYQRPNHLMARFARRHRTFFFEEPIVEPGPPRLQIESVGKGNLLVATPHLPHGSPDEMAAAERALLHRMVDDYRITRHVLWFYTPLALRFASQLKPHLTVYDCMDELTAFDGAHPELATYEQELFKRADLVFTGGHSLWEAKRHHHPRVFAFPSSVDLAHFAQAREPQDEPGDQASIPRPRIGFFGVIDERMDLELIANIAARQPSWQIVMVGPVVKIDPATLPRAANVHWLGAKGYHELPRYLAGWEVAFMPFALNESTRFISPTKTLEYLAAGRPVVSTAIRDVVKPYGDEGLVRIGEPSSFVSELEQALTEDGAKRRAAADAFLSRTSWDETFRQMNEVMQRCSTT